LSNYPDRRYFDGVSHETDYNRGVLEKAYRLLALVKEMHTNPRLVDCLALKGGTAIQFIYLGMKRLSVDVDLNYVGSIEKVVMVKDRLEIRQILEKLIKSQDYRFDKPYSMYLEEQFELGYTTASGSTDKLKVEINYGERLPVLELKKQTFEHPFTMLGEVQSISYGFEEIMAQKVRALVSRGTARDLYDAQLFSMAERPYDAALFKKLFLFYLILNKEDARKVTDLKIRQISKDDVKRWLVPLLRRRDYRIDLEEMRAPVLEFVKGLLDFSEDERRFLDRFYDECVFDQGLLFDDIPVKNDLARHPMVQWRLGGGVEAQ